MVLVGIPEIKRRDLAEPDEVPLVNWLVETVELFGLFNYLLGYLIAFYSLINRHPAFYRAPRGKLYDQKGYKGDSEQGGKHKQKSFQDIVFHWEENPGERKLYTQRNGKIRKTPGTIVAVNMSKSDFVNESE